MVACRRCGTQNAPTESTCSACGEQLRPEAPGQLSKTQVVGTPAPADARPAGPKAAPALKSTMLGIAPPAPGAVTPPAPAGGPAAGPPQPAPGPTTPGSAQPAPGAAPDLKGTMLGVAPAPPTSGAGQPDPAQKRAPPKQTMIGLAPAPGGFAPVPHPQKAAPAGPAPVPQASPVSGAPAPPPAPAVPAQPGPAGLPSGKKTMLGVAVPGIAPIQPGVAKPPSTPPAAPQQPGPGGLPPTKKTVMGVAIPGIAPIQPGVAKPPSEPPPQPPAAAPVPWGTPDYTPPPPAPGSGLGLVIAAASALALAVLLGAVVLLVVTWGSRGPLTASVTLDEAGKEQLQLECDGCSDGTTAKLGSETVKFVGGQATLPLAVPLKVGENQLTVSLTRPGGSTEDVPLVVPVQYRITGDFSGLSESPPVLHVLVEAVDETVVVIDGKPARLGPGGRQRVDIDVSEDLTGPATVRKRLERRIPYTVAPPSSDSQSGEVTLQMGIVPLEVNAPGESIVIQNATFMLAGQTQKGGSVTVSGRPITVDPSGRFAQLMNVSSVGKTTIIVRAKAPDHAPRLFPIKVRRVKSLREEARGFANRASRAFAAISPDIQSKRGWAVALEGKVVEARTHNHTSVILLDVSRGCPQRPCLARVIHGAKLAAQAGNRITVYGQLLGAVDGPRSGSKIPEIRAEFVLDGSGP